MQDQVNFGEVCVQGPEVLPSYSQDVTKMAIKKGWIKQFYPGQWYYAENMTKLFRVFNEIFRREIVKPLGFKEWIFPRLLRRSVLTSFGCTIWTPELLFNILEYDKDEQTQNPHMLDPVQCAGFYEVLSKENINDAELPIKVFEVMGGWTWRNESHLEGMIRLKEFMRAEFIYISNKDQVTDIRKQIIEKMTHILNKLNLKWRLVVGKPCCIIPDEIERFKKANNMDEVPTLDFELYIPFETEDKQWLEIAGCNVEGNRLIKAFSVSTEQDQDLWSGCVGAGLNRLVFGFLAQYGFNPENWPDLIRREFGKV